MTGDDIREVLPEVFRIPVPLAGNPLKELNCYLFRGRKEAGERNLLVDTGFRTEGCRLAVLEGLGLLGVSMEDSSDASACRPQWKCGRSERSGRKGFCKPDRSPLYGWEPAGK